MAQTIKYRKIYTLDKHARFSIRWITIRFDKIREDHWRDLAVESNDKKKIHALRWSVYAKDKEELITRSFSVSVSHPKGGKLYGIL